MPIASALLLSSFVLIQDRPPQVLPLRKLRLYETGIGYFERRGSVGAKENVTLPLPTSHLDDALKSLVVLHASSGIHIQGIEFDSSVSEDMARALAGLPMEPDQPLDYDDLLDSLKGSRVELHTESGRIRGRLIDLEGPFYMRSTSETRSDDSDAGTQPWQPRGEPHYTLIMLDDDDALRRVKTDRVEAIKVLEAGLAKRLDVAATALSEQTARRPSALEVQVSAAGQLGLGYIAEAPVWRTTYRVVMDDDEATGQLQAWALVHNDTDEDWDRVQIELANGRPRSFLHPLAAPRYASRELIAPPDDLSTVPQLANQTAGSLWGSGVGEAFGLGGLGLVGTGRGGGGTGEGTIGLGSVGLIGHGGGSLGDLATLSQATGAESGALFVYRVVDPIDLRAHHSALLPIVQEEIEIESIVLFGTSGGDGLSAARLVNSTAQTLPAGAVSFFADGGFVGEAVIDRLRPEERRFLAYGSELDVDLERTRVTLDEETTVLRRRGEEIIEHFLRRSEIQLDINNRGGRAQRVYVALNIPQRADLSGDGSVELDFDLATDTPMAVVDVEAKSKRSHTLTVKNLEQRRHNSIDIKTLKLLRDRKGLAKSQQEIIITALAHLRKSTRLDRDITRKQAAIATREQDLERIRKDLGALGQAQVSGRVRTQLSRDLLAKETQIAHLRTQISKHQNQANQARQAMRTTLERLDEYEPATK